MQTVYVIGSKNNGGVETQVHIKTEGNIPKYLK